MRISAIITTYEQPEWLELVLWGYSVQSFREFEIVVADDGSGAATAERLEALRPRIGVPVQHVWHAHEGFRKCEILNKAAAAARGDYLLFTDGDCIPRRDLLEVHAREARPGRFLSGGYLKLPPATSRRITPEDVRAGHATDYAWLRRNGAPATRQLLRLRAGPRLGALLDRLTPTRASFNGHNASCWRSDLLAVNGFEERMQYGGLDRELGERLENAGVRGRQIRHRALVVHLDHARGYRDPAALARNRAIRNETLRERRRQAVAGIDRHLAR